MIRRCFLVLCYSLFTFVPLFSQDTVSYWETSGLGSIIFSQVSLANWAGGGQNSISANANFIYSAIRTKSHSRWENTIDLGYGIIRQGNTNIRKSDDRINMLSKYNYKIFHEDWNLNGIIDFKSQFNKGFDPNNDNIIISRFLAPGYLVMGAGVQYIVDEKLEFSLNPLTGKFTFVQDRMLADRGSYGVSPAVYDTAGNKIQNGKTARAELGAFFRSTYTNDIFQTKLELFSNYIEKPDNIDVNWQNSLQLQVTKIFSVSLFTQLIYDDNIKIEKDDDGDGIPEAKPRTQFKSILGVGLTYKFGSKNEPE